MGTGTAAAAVGRTTLSPPGRRWLRHLLLAASLVVVALSIVGMHQLSVGHDVATGPSTSSAHAQAAQHGQSGEMLPLTTARPPAAHRSGGMTDRDMGGICPDCADHPMALGSCLLALTLLVLSWLLAPPRPTHVPPFLLPRLASTRVGSAEGRLVPALSLAQLSLRRT